MMVDLRIEGKDYYITASEVEDWIEQLMRTNRDLAAELEIYKPKASVEVQSVSFPSA